MAVETKITKWKEQGKYDAPRIGYVRWASFVNKELLNKFKEVAKKEKKTYVDALEEALQNWTYYEPE
jgi:hypothetical protein